MAVDFAGGLAKVTHPVRQSVRRWQHLRMTPQEREGLANTLLARRVLAEGMLLSLDGSDVRDGAVLSAHALCESQAKTRPIALRIGGQRANLPQITQARGRLHTEIGELDALVEAAIGGVVDEQPLSRDSGSTGTPEPRVVHLQNRLNALGHRVQADGVFGPITQEVVKDFQTRVGLDASGEVDSTTADALRRGKVQVAGVDVPAEMPSMAPQTASRPPLAPIGDGVQPAEQGNGGVSQTTAGGDKQPAEKSADGKKQGKSVSVNVKLKESALSSAERDALPDSAFVFAKGRRYPIHDRAHARNALSRSSGKPEEAAVKAAVYSRYPALKHVDEADTSDDLHKKRHPKTHKVHLVARGGTRTLCGYPAQDLDDVPGQPDDDDVPCAGCAAAATVMASADVSLGEAHLVIQLHGDGPIHRRKFASRDTAQKVARALRKKGHKVTFCEHDHHALAEDWSSFDEVRHGKHITPDMNTALNRLRAENQGRHKHGGHGVGDKVHYPGEEGKTLVGTVQSFQPGGRLRIAGPKGATADVHHTEVTKAEAEAHGIKGPSPGEMIANYKKMYGKAPSSAMLKKLRETPLEESPRTAMLAATPSPFSTSTTSNWVARTGGLPNYIQQVAKGVMKTGKSESQAIQIAIGKCEDWAEGRGGVSPEVKAAAAAAIAEFKGKAAASKAKTAAKDVSEASMVECETCGARLLESGVCQRGHRPLAESGSPKAHVAAFTKRRGRQTTADESSRSGYVDDLAKRAEAGSHPGGRKARIKALRQEYEDHMKAGRHAEAHRSLAKHDALVLAHRKARKLHESEELQEDWAKYDVERGAGGVDKGYGAADRKAGGAKRGLYGAAPAGSEKAAAAAWLARANMGNLTLLKTGGWKQMGESPSAKTVSKNTFTYDPVPMDRLDPHARLSKGDIVRVTRLHGAPPPGTMDQYHVAHHETGELLGMVSGNSLKPVADPTAGLAHGTGYVKDVKVTPSKVRPTGPPPNRGRGNW